MKLYKNLLFILVFSISFASSYGQNASVTWGEKAKSEKSYGDITILGWHGDYYYTIKRSSLYYGDDVVLEKISKDMTLIFSRKIDPKYRAYKSVFFELIDNEIHAFATKYHKNKNRMQFVTQTISLEGQLIQQKELESFPSNEMPHHFLDFALSPDKEHAVLISTSNFPEKRYSTLQYAVIPVDDVENTRYFEKKISFKNEQLNQGVAELAVDNNLTIYSIFRSKEEFDNPNINTLIVHDSKGNLLAENKLMKENIYFDNLNFKINKSNKVFVSGMLATVNNEKTSYNGFFFGKVDPSTYNITSLSPFLFTKEFFEKLDYKTGSDGRINFFGTYALDIVLFDKGGGYLLADHRSNNTKKFMSSFELLAMRFDDEGKLGETQVLVKDQEANYGYYYNAMGYSSMVKGNSLYLFYSDRIDNLNVTRKEDLKKMKDPEDNKVATIMAVFDETDQIKKSILFYNKEVKGYLIPGKCYFKGDIPIVSINNGKMVTYGKVNF